MQLYVTSLFLLLLTIYTAPVSSGLGKCKSAPNSMVPMWPVFAGHWYEYSSYGDWNTRTFYKCVNYDFTINKNNVHAERKYIQKWFGIHSSSKYAITVDNFKEFSMIGQSYLTPNMNMWLIDVDYDNYAILWSCTEYMFGAFHEDSSWILTRNQSASINKEVENKIKKVLKDNSLNMDWFAKVSLDGC